MNRNQFIAKAIETITADMRARGETFDIAAILKTARDAWDIEPPKVGILKATIVRLTKENAALSQELLNSKLNEIAALDKQLADFRQGNANPQNA